MGAPEEEPPTIEERVEPLCVLPTQPRRRVVWRRRVRVSRDPRPDPYAEMFHGDAHLREETVSSTLCLGKRPFAVEERKTEFDLDRYLALCAARPRGRDLPVAAPAGANRWRFARATDTPGHLASISQYEEWTFDAAAMVATRLVATSVDPET